MMKTCPEDMQQEIHYTHCIDISKGANTNEDVFNKIYYIGYSFKKSDTIKQHK